LFLENDSLCLTGKELQAREEFHQEMMTQNFDSGRAGNWQIQEV
jgi:hypothetical protein